MSIAGRGPGRQLLYPYGTDFYSDLTHSLQVVDIPKDPSFLWYKLYNSTCAITEPVVFNYFIPI